MNHLQKNNHKKSTEPAEQMLSPFLSIQREFDRALHGFYDLFESRAFNLREFENLRISPSIDLIEDDKSYKIEVEMPGMDENDIKISIKDNLLKIHGEKSSSKKNKDKNYIAREITFGCYDRSIVLPRSADGNHATASFKKGMLWINIPKKVEDIENERQIKIEKAND